MVLIVRRDRGRNRIRTGPLVCYLQEPQDMLTLIPKNTCFAIFFLETEKNGKKDSGMKTKNEN